MTLHLPAAQPSSLGLRGTGEGCRLFPPPPQSATACWRCFSVPLLNGSVASQQKALSEVCQPWRLPEGSSTPAN